MPTITVTNDDIQRQLTNLIQPQTITNLDGSDYVLPPILHQINTLKWKESGGNPGGGDTTGGSSPLSFAALDWENSLINAISDAYEHGFPLGTANTSVLYARKNSVVYGWEEKLYRQLEHLTQQAWTIIYPSKFEIIGPCPNCGSHTARIGDALSTAIHVHDVFARCGCCHTMWWGREIIDLADQVGALKTEQCVIH